MRTPRQSRYRNNIHIHQALNSYFNKFVGVLSFKLYGYRQAHGSNFHPARRRAATERRRCRWCRWGPLIPNVVFLIEKDRLELFKVKLTVAYCVMISQDFFSLFYTEFSAILFEGLSDIIRCDEFRIISVKMLEQGVKLFFCEH